LRVRVLRWPYPYRWAFGITDDTDGCTMESVRAVYEYCTRLGIWPTKTVWTQQASERCGLLHQWEPDDGLTLDDPQYRRYCGELSERGVEFALHGVSAGNNTREEVLRGLERFRETFGYLPRLYVCHSLNAEHPYWGVNHYRSRLARFAVRLLTRPERFCGDEPGSPYYWADVCRETIHYVRLYRTLDLNVLRHNPHMPYHEKGKPGVRFWFSACAQDTQLCERVTDRALDRVAREDGALILYAHMRKFLAEDIRTESGLRPEVERAFRTIAARDDCWCAGVSRILDRCLAAKNVVVQERRQGVVLGNPTAVPLPDFQVSAGCDRLFLPGGEEIVPDAEGRFRVGDLGAYSSLALYYTREDAELGDVVGISRREQAGMMLEEAKHLVWQRCGYGWFNWAKRWTGRLRPRAGVRLPGREAEPVPERAVETV